MKLKVTYTTQLRAVLQTDSEEIELSDGSGWPELLRALSTRHPEEFPRYTLDSRGNFAPSILVCLNDEQVRPGAGRPLVDGDHVTFLSAISGG